MKLLSASFFLALGLAIGTTISALAGAGAGAGAGVGVGASASASAGGRHVDVVSDATVKDVVSVLERNETS